MTSSPIGGIARREWRAMLSAVITSTDTPSRMLLVGLVVCYTALLTWCYENVIAQVYAYAGMRNVLVSSSEAYAALACGIVPCLWLPVGPARPSHLVLWFQYLIVYIPTCVVAVRNASPLGPSVWPLIATLMAALAIVQLVTSMRRVQLSRHRLRYSTYQVALWGIGAGLLAPVVLAFGMPNGLPSLVDIYVVRASYHEMVTETGRGVGYAVFWLSAVVAPLLILDGLTSRKVLPIGASFGIAIYIFAVSGMKSVGLSCFLVVGLYWIYGRTGVGMGVRLAGSVLVFAAGAAIADILTGQWLLTSLLTRRVLLVPGLLTGQYYDFFASHPVTQLGASFLAALGQNPYDAPVSVVIGATYYGSPDVSANVNLWGDAIANFGLLGVIAYACILGVILWAFDSVAVGTSARRAVLMISLPAFALTNSALPTTILTGGLWLLFCAALLAPAEKRSSEVLPALVRNSV